MKFKSYERFLEEKGKVAISFSNVTLGLKIE
jgi:hypothetical protein